MNVSKEDLLKKFQELIPDQSKNVSSEVFSSLCNNNDVQSFLKWFCSNISKFNVLSEDEMGMAKQIKKSGNYLTGTELKNVLDEELKVRPELEEALCSDSFNISQTIPEYEREKDEYLEDVEYLKFLENQYKKLQQVGHQLEEQLENDETLLDKQQAELQKNYSKCDKIVNEFHFACQEYATSLRQLHELYITSNDKKNGSTWVQMPLELFIEHLETYSKYIEMYIKKQLGDNIDLNQIEHSLNILNASISDNERMSTLSVLRNNISKAKYNELYEKVLCETWETLSKIAKSMYNNGQLMQIPQNSIQLRMEMTEMMRKRDSIEENTKLLNEQLSDEAQKFADNEINEFLVNFIETRIEYQKQMLEKLYHLEELSGKGGLAYSDLLCLHMSSQFQCISDIYHFTKEAHFFQTECSLIEERCELMRKLQEEYKMISSHTTEQNIFNKLLLKITECENGTHINESIKSYERLLNENSENIKIHLQNKQMIPLKKVIEVNKEFSKIYLEQLDNGLTRKFRHSNDETSIKLEEISTKAANCQSNFQTMHNKFKEIVKNINEFPLEREKATLWQTFLAAPHLVQTKYDELKAEVDRSHFKDDL